MVDYKIPFLIGAGMSFISLLAIQKMPFFKSLVKKSINCVKENINTVNAHQFNPPFGQ
jgi:hypothetical protein